LILLGGESRGETRALGVFEPADDGVVLRGTAEEVVELERPGLIYDQLIPTHGSGLRVRATIAWSAERRRWFRCQAVELNHGG
jgi:hypothetical protein